MNSLSLGQGQGQGFALVLGLGLALGLVLVLGLGLSLGLGLGLSVMNQRREMKILNLYAGIGGNRKLWSSEHDITAVEINPEIAKIYKDFFPDDTVVVADAHQYLLDHFNEFDFIWSSPPCPTHSQFRYRCGHLAWGQKAVYPDMNLYQEIIFLKYYFKGRWVVENTESYYQPLIKCQKIARHFFWSDFYILPFDSIALNIKKNQIDEFEEMRGFDLSSYELADKRKILRNCVNPDVGLHIFNCAFKEKQTTIKTVVEQIK